MSRARFFVGFLFLFPLNFLGCASGEVAGGGDSEKEAAGTGTLGSTAAGGVTGIAASIGGNPPTSATTLPATGGSSGTQSGLNASPVECFSPFVCAPYCGSPETFNSGCRSCPLGTIDTRACQQPTITEGVAGVVNWSEGDFMPVADSVRPSRFPKPLSAQIRVYSAVTESDAISSNRGPRTLFAQINGTLVATTTSDAAGLYQVKLPPGDYSVFVGDNGEWFCNSFSGRGELCLAAVTVNTISRYDINVNYMATY